MAAKTAPAVRHLTITQLAERLGIEPGTLRVWRMNGRGPAYIQDGEGFIRYRLTDIEAWEKSRLVETAGT